MAATAPPRRVKKHGQDFPEGPPGPQSQVSEPGIQPLPPLRSPARLLPQVRPLPDLPARGRPRGLRPRHDQVELVALCTPTQSPFPCPGPPTRSAPATTTWTFPPRP